MRRLYIKRAVAVTLSVALLAGNGTIPAGVVHATEVNETEEVSEESSEAPMVDITEEKYADTYGSVAINEDNFPDAVFREYISDEFDTDEDGTLSEDERSAVVEITVDEKGITSLKGIEYFANLKVLSCGDNQLSSLDVSENANLTQLQCSSNQLRSLDVSQNANLWLLSCGYNQLSSLDVSQNKNLWLLLCVGNQLGSLDVSQNKNLTTLYCNDNELSSLDISKNEKLIELRCSNNQLENLNIENNTLLKYLYCSNNKLSSIDISNAPQLYGLICSDNQLTSLDMADNEELGWLECANNKLESLICGARINDLECTNNPLTVLDVSRCENLHYLKYSYGYPKSLDLSSNTNLVSIDMLVAYRNQKLDFSNISGLDMSNINNELGSDYWNSTVQILDLDESLFEYQDEGAGRFIETYWFSLEVDDCVIYIWTENPDLLIKKASLDKSEMSMKVGATAVLEATVSPTNATNQELVWTSSDENVATVDSTGKVTAVAAGTATITCTAQDGSGVTATCEVTITEAETPKKPWVFTDVAVNEGNWKYEAVKYVYEHGYMTGTSTTTFAPDKPLTRGMVVTVLYRMAGSPDVTYTGNYSDVTTGKYYAKAVAWASENKIATGYSDGTFGAEKNISRQELAKMMCQFAKLQGYDTSATTDISGFIDYSKVSGYAMPYMQWAVATNLISGKNKSGTYYLDPRGEATRAECAAIIQRYEEHYSD